MRDGRGSSGAQATIAAAESVLRAGLAVLEAIGDRAFYPTVGAAARAMPVRAGALRRGPRAVREGPRGDHSDDDLINFVYARLPRRAACCAREGRFAEAEEAARRAIAATSIAIETDYFFAGVRPRLTSPRSLVSAGKADEAARARRRGRSRSRERKGDVAGAARRPRAPRGARHRDLPDRRRRALLTSLHGDRVPPGGDRAPRRARAEVRQGGAHVRRRPAPSGRVARPPERRLDDHAADTVDLAEHPGRSRPRWTR